MTDQHEHQHGHGHEEHAPQPQPSSRQEWDDRYSERESLWSGNPNGQLVHEVDDLTPGHALDVGCGEGADALWLAEKGWQVTAADISGVALDRARAHAAARTEATGTAPAVTWLHVDYSQERPAPNTFDLVSMQYFALKKQPGDPSLRALVEAVKPGGTVLAIHHDPADMTHIPDLDEYYFPVDVARVLGEDWTVQVDEVRDRRSVAPSGTQHTKDIVLRAVRRGPTSL